MNSITLLLPQMNEDLNKLVSQVRRDILKEKGVILDHSVQHHDGKYIVILNKEYDFNELDKLTDG